VGHVVALGNLLSKFGTYSLYSAIIVKKFDEKTRAKIGINLTHPLKYVSLI
jgi:2,3,4,5-tetrahydropyridine-2-carboxylate N-succinyltransferase